MSNNYCFASLALGKRFRLHAIELAKDLEKFAPGISYLVLTDKPQDFSSFSNVLAYYHQGQSVYLIHDKKFVIQKALSLFNSCIYIDADARILKPVPDNLLWSPGITASSRAQLAKHMTIHVECASGARKEQCIKHMETLHKIAPKLGLNLEDTSISFVMEHFYVVTRDSGKENDFIKWWGLIGQYEELHGFSYADGFAIGLAAAKAGMLVANPGDSMNSIHYFKDWVERAKIRKGTSELIDADKFFEEHKKIEFPKRSLWKKVVNKIQRKLGYHYRVFRLKQIASTNKEFFLS